MSSEHDPKLPDLRYIRELAKVFKQYELDELEIETEGTRMLLRRGDMPANMVAAPMSIAPATAPAIAAAPVAAAHVAAGEREEPAAGDFITSPFVGTFYRSPSPDAPPFVDVGSQIREGQALCIIEAMKLFNEIEAEFACTIEELLVENGQPVEYGAKLFRVRKL